MCVASLLGLTALTIFVHSTLLYFLLTWGKVLARAFRFVLISAPLTDRAALNSFIEHKL